MAPKTIPRALLFENINETAKKKKNIKNVQLAVSTISSF